MPQFRGVKEAPLRPTFLVLFLLAGACATSAPRHAFEGLDPVGGGIVAPRPDVEETVRYGTEVETLMNETMRDQLVSRQFARALEKIPSDRTAARQDLYNLVTRRQASRLTTPEQQLLFGELARLAIIRLTFPSCHDQLALIRLRSVETAGGDVSEEWARVRADAYLRWQYKLGCD